MRKSNILAEQGDALIQQENEKSASWQRKVVQRWVEPTLRLVKAILSNAATTHKVVSKKLRAVKKKIAPKVKPGSKAHKKRKTEHEKPSVIVNFLASVKFHVCSEVLLDVLTSLSQLSLEGQQQNGSAARIRNMLRMVKEELRELQNKHGPCERWLRQNLVVRKEIQQAVLHGWVLDSKGVRGARLTKTILLTKLLQELEERF